MENTGVPAVREPFLQKERLQIVLFAAENSQQCGGAIKGMTESELRWRVATAQTRCKGGYVLGAAEKLVKVGQVELSVISLRLCTSLA